MRTNKTAPTETGAPELDLLYLWGVLRRQRWIILAGSALGIISAAVLIGRPDPVYDASALIRVEEQRGGIPGLAIGTGSDLETEMQVLRSRTVVGPVVDSLQLQIRITEPHGVSRDEVLRAFRATPNVESGTLRFIRAANGVFTVVDATTEAALGRAEIGEEATIRGAVLVLAPRAAEYPEIEVALLSRDEAVDELVGTLAIARPTRNADLIRVAYRDGDPEMASDVVNTVVDRFLQLRMEGQKTEVRSTIQFLTEQIASVKSELIAAEDQLQTFRERSHVIDPLVEGSTQVRRLAELQGERSALEAERAALATLVDEIERGGGSADVGAPSPYRRLAAFPPLMASEVFSEILRSLTALEGERAGLLLRRRESDQDVEVFTARIRVLEAELKDFVNTYIAGLSSQIASTDANLGAYGDQLATLPADEVEFARLSRQPKLLGEMYGVLQTRLQEAQVAQAVDDSSVRIVDPAVVPIKAANSARWKIEFLAMSCLGLVLGLTVGFVREYADTSIYTRAEVETASGIPVLGLVPQVKRKGRFARPDTPPRLLSGRPAATTNGALQRAVPLAIESSGSGEGCGRLMMGPGATPLSDAYDRLHTNILFALPNGDPTTLLVTSALPGDGKTTTAAHLAVAIARRGLKTLVIDADLRRGTVNGMFGGTRTPGLSELLAGTVTLPEVIRTTTFEQAEIHYIPSGKFPTQPASVVASREMRALIERLAPHFDRIIIDSPPVNVVADAAVLARHVDGVILVVRAGVTPQEALTMAADQLEKDGVKVAGVVLNCVDFERHGSYDSAYKSYSYGRKYYAAGVG